MRRLDDAGEVRDQYANEDNLRARQSIYSGYRGPDARQIAFDAIAAGQPRHVLEVGGGQGELAERLVRELQVTLRFVDQSSRMVELARARGIDAIVGDVQQLPFDDETFDTVVAAWMLYHVPDLDRAVSEMARVLAPGGTLVAVTNADHHLKELRELFGRDFVSSFTRENGKEILLRHFGHVEQTDFGGVVTITDPDVVIAYRDSMITAEKDRELVFDVPFETHTAVTVFVARR